MSGASYPMALIRLGLSCNNACLFCHSRGSGNRAADLSTARAREKIRAAARAGAKTAVFSGGEPTIRKDIIALCEYAAGLGLDSGLITNGRMLVYKDFVHRLAAAGLTYILISIHGADARTHDRLVGAKAFAQTMKGLENIARLPLRITVNTVLTRLNRDTPPGLAEILGSLSPIHYKISLPEPRGALLADKNLVLPMGEASSLAHAFTRALSQVRGISFGFDGFTPCTLENFLSLNDDFHTHGFCLVSEPGEQRFFPPDHGDRVFAGSCNACSVQNICPGIYAKYLEWFPETSLSPIVKPVSNSVHFHIQSTSGLKSGRRICRSEIMRQPMPARRIAVKSNNKIFLYNTQEKETDTEELLKLKQEQVFRFDSSSPEPYPRNLKKMKLWHECSGCERLMCCPGLYVSSGERPHATALKKEKALLRHAKGRILDIGCGNVPFLTEFKKIMTKKQISLYVGIDPQPVSDFPCEKGFTLIQSAIENFEWPEKPFDTVFLFRSWNHLENLELAMTAIHQATRPGSLLMITEDRRHIELHSNPPEEPGEKQGPCFQHYRNHSFQQAVAVIEHSGFVCSPVSTSDRVLSNHWIISATRK